MALTYKPSSLNGMTFMKKVGVSAVLVDQLIGARWSVKLTANEVVITKDETKFSYPMEMATLTALNEGKLSLDKINEIENALSKHANTALGLASHEAIAAQAQPVPDPQALFKSTLVGLTPVQQVEKVADAYGSLVWNDLSKIDMIKTFRSYTGAGLKEAKDAVEAWLGAKYGPANGGYAFTPLQPATPEIVKVLSTESWPCFPLKEMETAPTVKLRDANRMYQPVKGTSGNSRYFMVAASKDVRVAVRYSGSALSIRIEGPNWQKWKANISSAGFDTISAEKDYASVHLNVEDEMTANKSLGAVLMGIGAPFETMFPQLGVVKGKGH
jgi:ribosomal protein L7/L12